MIGHKSPPIATQSGQWQPQPCTCTLYSFKQNKTKLYGPWILAGATMTDSMQRPLLLRARSDYRYKVTEWGSFQGYLITWRYWHVTGGIFYCRSCCGSKPFPAVKRVLSLGKRENPFSVPRWEVQNLRTCNVSLWVVWMPFTIYRLSRFDGVHGSLNALLRQWLGPGYNTWQCLHCN